MAEYIKREDAISHPFANERYDKKNANLDFILGFESYKEWLENLPAADVRENVRGKWEPIDDLPIDEANTFVCSVCHGEYDTQSGSYDLPYFCQNCGADMRGEQK